MADDDASSASGDGDGELAELLLADPPTFESQQITLLLLHHVCMSWLSDRVQCVSLFMLMIPCMMVLLVRLGFDVTQRSVEPPSAF